MIIDTSVDGVVDIDGKIVINYNMKVLTLNKKMSLHETSDLIFEARRLCGVARSYNRDRPISKTTRTSTNKNGATQFYDKYVLVNTWTLKENYETV